MSKKRFIVELGFGVDLHGEDVTAAACRAVKDAVSRSCLCGLLEILQIEDLKDVEVEIMVACPRPENVDRIRVADQVPIGVKTVYVVDGGMETRGLCVPRFAPGCDRIVVANAAVTVWVKSRE